MGGDERPEELLACAGCFRERLLPLGQLPRDVSVEMYVVAR
jgi:hypothetical protein